MKECQRLGILVDVSHISDEGFRDIMKITEAPIVASHSNSRAVCNVSRNLTDEMFLALCRTRGVAGINLYAHFLGKGRVTLDTVADHILHFLELDPDGSQNYNALAERLASRGLKEKTIHDIYWNNAIGVMEHAVRNHKIGC